jgi:hypothetical protein
MNRSPGNRIVACAFVATCIASPASAQPAGVEARAAEVLRAMTTYVASLKQFKAQTENTLEVVTPDGQKIQFSAPATVTVSRPNKMVATRQGDIVDQAFYYDGSTLTLFDPATKYYATVPAPANVDDMIDFARTKLDLIAPGADLIHGRAYDMLMQDVTSGAYLGLAAMGGYRCHHLAFRGAEVDWQLWVREGSWPVPCRYVITSKGIAGAPQFSVQIVGWDNAPAITPAMFTFVPPAGAKAIEFLPVNRAR